MPKLMFLSPNDLCYQERLIASQAKLWVAGVDEAGRGPLAGPVVAAICLLPVVDTPLLPADSKVLSSTARSQLFSSIQCAALPWAVGSASPEEIDLYNIREATRLAMARAWKALPFIPEMVWVDGDFTFPTDKVPVESVVGGDRTLYPIALAATIAKETRDAIMREADEQWPHYAFSRHKGYGTALHREKLSQHGLSPIHRKSFCSRCTLPPPVCYSGAPLPTPATL